MLFQPPAEGILKMSGYPNWKQYSVPCTCGCEKSVNLVFEIEEPTDEIITCHISSELTTNYWTEPFRVTYQEHWFVQGLKTFLNEIIIRAKLVAQVLFHGKITAHSYILLSEQQAFNMSEIMKTAITDLRNGK